METARRTALTYGSDGCPHRTVPRWIAIVGVAAVLPHAAFGQAGAAARVTITGGADESGHNYKWTVTNLSLSPIVRVEFPHYFADLCLGPPGWSTAETTNLINVGSKDTSGVCVATAPTPSAGIGRNESLDFTMRIAPAGAATGFGDAAVVFADGTRTTISGVQLPKPRPLGDTFVSLAGLGVIFAGWLLVRYLRGRRGRSTSPDSAAPPS